MEKKYIIHTKEENSNRIGIIAMLILMAGILWRGFNSIFLELDYAAQLGIEGTFPGVLLKLGMLVIFLISFFILKFLLEIFLRDVLYTKKEVTARIKSNQTKINKLIEKNSKLKELIK